MTRIKITAEFEVVTPMFLGDGLQKANDIRPPAIKGALRFWWRALNWSKFYQAEGQNEKAALKALHTKEAELFGSSAKTVDGKQLGGQGKVALRLKPLKTGERSSTQQAFGKSSASMSGTSYLLGLGLVEKKEIVRDYLAADQKFQLDLLWRSEEKYHDDLNDILLSLQLMSVFGGLGARSRKGFGALRLNKLESSRPIDGVIELDSITSSARGVFPKLFPDSITSCTEEPPFSALSSHSRCFLGKGYKRWDALIEAVGKDLQSYRMGEGHAFKNDTDTFRKSAFERDYAAPFPDRAMFGLPYTNQFKGGRTVTIEPKSEGINRRASPLFISVFKDPESNLYHPTFLYMRSQFLPEQVEIGMNVKDDNQTRKVTKGLLIKNDRWSTIVNFLNTNGGQQIWPIKEGN